MDLAGLTPIIIALISTGIGGLGLKGFEHFLNKKSKQTDVATDIREELRTDARYAREELKKAEIDLDELRDKYFKLMQESLEIKSQLQEFIKYIDNLKAEQKKEGE